MAQIKPADVKEAAEILGICERASFNEIRQMYRDQIKKIHPDVSEKSPAVSNEETLRLNKAYSVLVSYCMNYSISFADEDISESLHFSKISYEDFWNERFRDDPIWG